MVWRKATDDDETDEGFGYASLAWTIVARLISVSSSTLIAKKQQGEALRCSKAK